MQAPADNIFVKILAGDLPSYKVYSNSYVYAFLDIYPQNLGHTLVIPREYCRNFEDARPADIAACWEAVRLITPALRGATGAHGVTVITNNGKEAGQMIDYLHFHMVPRFKGDNASLHQLGEKPEDSELEAMAEKIRSLIEKNRAESSNG